MTLSVLLWSYLILSDTHVEWFGATMQGADFPWFSTQKKCQIQSQDSLICHNFRPLAPSLTSRCWRSWWRWVDQCLELFEGTLVDAPAASVVVVVVVVAVAVGVVGVVVGASFCGRRGRLLLVESRLGPKVQKWHLSAVFRFVRLDTKSIFGCSEYPLLCPCTCCTVGFATLLPPCYYTSSQKASLTYQGKLPKICGYQGEQTDVWRWFRDSLAFSSFLGSSRRSIDSPNSPSPTNTTITQPKGIQKAIFSGSWMTWDSMNVIEKTLIRKKTWQRRHLTHIRKKKHETNGSPESYFCHFCCCPFLMGWEL